MIVGMLIMIRSNLENVLGFHFSVRVKKQGLLTSQLIILTKLLINIATIGINLTILVFNLGIRWFHMIIILEKFHFWLRPRSNFLPVIEIVHLILVWRPNFELVHLDNYHFERK